VRDLSPALQGNLPKGQESKPEKQRTPPNPYLRIQKTDTSSNDPNEQKKLADDVLRLRGREPTGQERELYKKCLSVMDDISEANMNMLEHIGEFLGRHITGRLDGGGRNLLRDYVKEYVLGRKE
jgi:hypothetical protein